jgi:hypothetical protein
LLSIGVAIAGAPARLAGGMTTFADCCGTRANCGVAALRLVGELRGVALRGTDATALTRAPRCGTVVCFLANGIDGNVHGKAGPMSGDPEFAPRAPAAAVEL